MRAPLNVLLIEDSEDDALLLLRELRRGGYDPTFERVETPKDMKAALENQTWDVIISDYVMPRFSGPAALALLKEYGFDVPFIIVSGKVGEETAVQVMKAGAHDYIMKDNLAKLVPAIKRELQDAEVRRERTQAEDELRKSRDKLRKLSSHLQTVREEERTAIAREVHDELGQLLTAIKFDVSWLRKRIPKEATDGIEKTGSILKLIDSAIQSVKRISSDLRPVVLDDLGIAAAMKWEANKFENRTKKICKVRLSPEDIVLDRDRSTAVFRIFQEALTNVARHSGATEVTATLGIEDHLVKLSVVDNGRGITEEMTSSSDSLGLIGMRERVIAWNGEIEIKGQKGKGTSVGVSIPLGS
ncbi:MAG: histidine kinase [Candidatus Neomarinimicrobiota bacterium]